MTRRWVRCDGGWGLVQKPKPGMRPEVCWRVLHCTSGRCERCPQCGICGHPQPENTMVEARWNWNHDRRERRLRRRRRQPVLPSRRGRGRSSAAVRSHDVCPWKGTAHYYDVVVGDQVNATPPGTTRRRSPPRARSRTASRSGRVSRSVADVVASAGQHGAVASMSRVALARGFAAVAFACTTPAFAQPAAPRFEDTIEQRMQACVVCHGERGGGVTGAAFPRLAGQPVATWSRR